MEINEIHKTAIRKMKNIALIIFTLTFISCQTIMAVIKQNDKYGLINAKNKMVVKPQWDYILGESEGFYPVETDSMWGYIDRKGEVIIEPQYWDANFFDEGYACVGNVNGKYGFIDKKGDTIMIVEAMKTMNHVPSTADGTVKEICVEDGQPVEFGQTIIILD